MGLVGRASAADLQPVGHSRNFQALFRPPVAPRQWGAITLGELTQAVEQGVEGEEIDPSQLDRITRRALRRAKRISLQASRVPPTSEPGPRPPSPTLNSDIS